MTTRSAQPDPPTAAASPRSPRRRLCYVTANDDPWLSVDWLNLHRMCRLDPGVSPIEVCLAVSEVRPAGRLDRAALRRLIGLVERCPHFELRHAFFKDNTGRDFSSVGRCLRRLADDAGDDDAVMIVNRSAYGPFCENWYGAYLQQMERHPGAAACGTTINLVGLPGADKHGVTTHIQTYAYVVRFGAVRPMLDAFPGERVWGNYEAVVDGEILLSNRLLREGHALTCLAWPDVAFTWERPDGSPAGGGAAGPASLPFRHKFTKYRRRPVAAAQRLRCVASTCLASPGETCRAVSRKVGSTYAKLGRRVGRIAAGH